ncbi:MAG: LPS assembly protein LptD [Proteobacteria bacterium]|uniref:LPS-assembly protein LptD n=1 Tax=Candidatus Avisuccinivibrio stercorigallinarum TaxID=2840704 RepID=A0A9D9DD03_9GAMM|nr:LPS assembly protein LptD [Candidatus Avisuccinivibrio stercorigallinarum]
MQSSRKRQAAAWQQFNYSVLSAAIAAVLAMPAVSFAAEQEAGSAAELTRAVSIRQDEADIMAKRRLQAVTSQSTRIFYLMQQYSSQRYLQNRHLSASSTFPLRLFGRLAQNPWQAAPFMPVPERDLACYYGIPPYREPLEYDVNTTPVNIAADSVMGSLEQDIVYEGNVELTQGDKVLTADKTSYDGKSGVLTSSGNITYQNGQYTITSQKPIVSNLKSKVTSIEEAQVQLNGSVARAVTTGMDIDNENKSSTIEELSFSTCPASAEFWRITADDVDLVQGEAYGSATNATVWIKDVPVFYLPYVTFPISNERKSGLLYPEISFSSDNGFDYAQPIYWNIAPNYDDTFTPRYMSKRGIAFNNEFRYMPIEDSEGSITIDYIPYDNNWELSRDDHQRWMIDWKHESSFFNDDLTVDLDFARVRPGDYDFLSDIGSDGASITDDHLVQSLRTAYNRPSYDIGLEVRTYQSLIPYEASIIRPFSMLPQLTASYYNTYGAALVSVDGEITQFSSPDERGYDSFEASRIHLEPALSYQLYNSRGTSLTADGRLFLTHYEQDSLSDLPDYYRDELGFTKLDSSVDRALYLLEMRGKTTLERKVLDLRHTQTLEPEIAYRFIPYKDQNDIGLYDTTDRMTDYYSNFSFRHFTGNDRIADVNEVTFGFTSRLLDPHDRELLRMSISQTYSFVPTRVTLNPSDSRSDYPRSPLSMTVDANPLEGWTMHGGVSYTNETNSITAWNAMTEYVTDQGLKAQISYRFADEGNRTLENDPVDLDQLGLQLELPLTQNLKFIGAFYRDLEQENDIDKKLALRYEECCWAVTFMIEDYNKTDWEDLSRDKERRIGIQFEFKGLGAVNVSGSKDPASTDTALLDHFNPTNLNN